MRAEGDMQIAQPQPTIDTKAVATQNNWKATAEHRAPRADAIVDQHLTEDDIRMISVARGDATDLFTSLRIIQRCGAPSATHSWPPSRSPPGRRGRVDVPVDQDRARSCGNEAFFEIGHLCGKQADRGRQYTCTLACYDALMPRNIQIRDVDDEVYDALARRAAEVGLSVPEYLRREAERLAARPTVAEWLDRTRRRSDARTARDTLEALDELRGNWPT